MLFFHIDCPVAAHGSSFRVVLPYERLLIAGVGHSSPVISRGRAG